MAAYDPKRPRPSSTADPDEAPPVESLLDPAPSDPPPAETDAQRDAAHEDPVPVESVDDEVAPEPATPPKPTVDEVDLRTAASANGNGSRPAPRRATEVPIASAPEEGTTNRAVLIAAVVSTSVVAVLVALLVRRRRHRDA